MEQEFKQKLSELSVLQDWVREYMRTEDHRDPFYRANIVQYELGDLVKMIVYRKAYGDKRWSEAEAETALGDLLVMIFCLADILGLDIFKAIVHGVERLEDKNWRRRMDRSKK